MLDRYGISVVEPEWTLHPESMGSKQKFWYHNPRDAADTDWLFKFPRPNTGEHWAEKVAAEVASCLGIAHARVELAVFEGKQGSATAAFTGPDRVLVHGNQLLELTFQGYNPTQRRRPAQHTLGKIWQTLEDVCYPSEAAEAAKFQFADYLILDALIGNTDRHDENWGLLQEGTAAGFTKTLAPSFDHASSLGRELSEERSSRALAENRLAVYAERGRGGIYWREDDRHGPSPLELVRRAVVEYPDYFRPALAKLAGRDDSNILEAVNRIPEGWATRTQRVFAAALMGYNGAHLRELA